MRPAARLPSTTPRRGSTASPGGERAALVGLFSGPSRQFDPEHSLDELAGLAAAAGATVVLRVLQDRPKPDPATFLGSGKLKALAASCDELRADLVIFDNELSPAQLRNLETALDRKVLDRTQLILDIFARRARTREGKLQVELAQLKYLLPRLVGASTALSRLGGGIGTRGPGETKLETDRRRIRHRISMLSKEIDNVSQRRAQLRERRHKAAVPTVALVGYTNAGKTTLFNLLTGDKAVASDALFVTLDPLVRKVRLPDRRELLVSDTVGFIERLPHSLVAAFRATLEEVAGSDLLAARHRRLESGARAPDGSGPPRARRSRRGRQCRQSRSSTRSIDWMPRERARLQRAVSRRHRHLSTDGRRPGRADWRDRRAAGARHGGHSARVRYRSGRRIGKG